MPTIHMYVGIAVIGLNAAAGLWGGIAWMRKEPSVWFWYVLRAAQVAVVLQAGLGVALIGAGSRPSEDLHIIYGVLPLVITVITEAMRVNGVTRETVDIDDVEALPHAEQVALARRVVLHEMAVMTVGVLVILGLALRAYFTGI
ncbi:MAG: hypothetical protein QOG62_1135 [Thermoleophilaceae bacterium]|jgi:hypothetical protein|nr:hypothetical protein [Thermoleophilaceae bacterium]